jgi:hypothetical protein
VHAFRFGRLNRGFVNFLIKKNIFVPCQPDKSDQSQEMAVSRKVLMLVDEAQVMVDGHPEHPNAFLGKPYRLQELREMSSAILRLMSKWEGGDGKLFVVS